MNNSALNALVVMVLFAIAFVNAQQDVCSDSLYLVLKGTKLEKMSPNEVQYFLQKDELCTRERQAARQAAEEKQTRRRGGKKALGIVLLCFFLTFGISFYVIFPFTVADN